MAARESRGRPDSLTLSETERRAMRRGARFPDEAERRDREKVETVRYDDPVHARRRRAQRQQVAVEGVDRAEVVKPRTRPDLAQAFADLHDLLR